MAVGSSMLCGEPRMAIGVKWLDFGSNGLSLATGIVFLAAVVTVMMVSLALC